MFVLKHCDERHNERRNAQKNVTTKSGFSVTLLFVLLGSSALISGCYDPNQLGYSFQIISIYSCLLSSFRMLSAVFPMYSDHSLLDRDCRMPLAHFCLELQDFFMYSTICRSSNVSPSTVQFLCTLLVNRIVESGYNYCDRCVSLG